MAADHCFGPWGLEGGEGQGAENSGPLEVTQKVQEEEGVVASAPRREGEVMSKIFDTFGKTEKKLFLLFSSLRLMINGLSPKRKMIKTLILLGGLEMPFLRKTGSP